MSRLEPLFRNFCLTFGLLFLMFGLSNTALCASKKDENKKESILLLDGTTVRKVRFSNNLSLAETISCHKYGYDGFAPKNPYQYLMVRAHLVYKDGNDSTVATAYFEATFRYNKELKLAKCLSTSHKEYCSSPKHSINVLARTKNEALDKGGAFCKIVLSQNGISKNTCRYIFSCDENGQLSNHIVD